MPGEWSIGIPSSFTANLTSIIQRTTAAALVARAAAIFRVKTIYIYRDPITTDPEVLRQLIKLLRYINTPPYLRKDIFPLDRDLSYAGILPPLKTPLHKEWVAVKNLQLPDVRLGLVKGKYFGKYIVDVGLDKYLVVRGEVNVGSIVPVELEKVKGKYIWGRVLEDDELDERGIYPGYKVIRVKNRLPEFLRRFGGLVIGTSRKGDLVTEKYESLRHDLSKADKVLILFGSFEYGLDRILEYYDMTPEDVCSYYINLAPDQGVSTIRMEEAVLIALSILRFIENM